MDAVDFSTFFTLNQMVRKKLPDFLKANPIKAKLQLECLLFIDYLLKKRSRCYEYDLSFLLATRRGKPRYRGASITIGQLRRQGLIKYIKAEQDKKLQKSLVITDLGFSVLDNYRSYFNRIERELMYDIKKSRLK